MSHLRLVHFVFQEEEEEVEVEEEEEAVEVEEVEIVNVIQQKPMLPRVERITEVSSQVLQPNKMDTRYFGELLADVYRKNCDIHSCISEHVARIRGKSVGLWSFNRSKH